MSTPDLSSQEAAAEGVSALQLPDDAPGGRWLNRRLPLLLRDTAALVFLPVIVGVVSADVVGRYFFKHPFQWSQEVASLALLLLFVGSIPFTTAADGHVRTESLYEKYRPRMRAVIDALGAVFGAVFMALVAYWQVREIPGLIARGEGAEFIDLPYWPISVFVVLCMVFGVLQLSVRAVARTRAALRSETDVS